MSRLHQLNTVLIKVLLSAVLGIVIYLRHNFFSFVYLILYFSIPWWNTRPGTDAKAKLGSGLRLLIVFCGLIQTAQLTFQCVCFFFKNSYIFPFCSDQEIILRHVGLINWGDWQPYAISMSIVPDFIVMVILIISLNLLSQVDLNARYIYTEEKKFRLIIIAGKATVTIFLALAAIFSTSFLGMSYFILAILLAIYWAYTNRSFLNSVLLGIIVSLVICQLTAIFFLQMQLFEDIFPPIILNVFNLVKVVKVDCSQPFVEIVNPVGWEAFCIAPTLMVLYSFAASTLHHKIMLKRSLRYRNSIANKMTSRFEQKFQGRRHSNIMKSMIVLFDERILHESISFLACICMMLWSAVNIGLVSLVLLIWAAALCLAPRMRPRVVKSAPPLVFYCCCLLLVHYTFGVYPVDQQLRNLSLQEYGFVSYWNYTASLLTKTVFTSVFILLLREKLKARDAKPVVKSPRKDRTVHSQRVRDLFVNFAFVEARTLFLVGWILLVMALVVVIICTGATVTLFRLIYVLFFIFFVLVFEFSYEGWRNFLANYWLSLGVVTLLCLILQYLSFFHYIRNLWTSAGIDEKLQIKIGLEVKSDFDLQISVIKLSAFLIAVMVQIQLNEIFLETTDIRKRVKEQYTEDFISRLVQATIRYEVGVVRSILKLLVKFFKLLALVINYIMMHVYKILEVIVFWMILQHVSVAHWCIFFLTLVSLSLRHRRRKVLMQFLTILVSVHLLQWMILDLWDITDKHFICKQMLKSNFSAEAEARNYSRGAIEWAGFLRQQWRGESTADVVNHHMVVILISVATMGVARYFLFKSFLRGEFTHQTYVLFPEVKANDADYNVANCIKFFINYAFYKFGVEICFIAMATVAAVRWDMYSLLLVACLLAFLPLSREALSRLWDAFVYLTYFCLLVKYGFHLDLPPPMCLAYPWYNSRPWRVLQDWMYLPDPFFVTSTSNLFGETILVLLLSRQQVVFSIERKHGSTYAGGSNYPPTEDTDDPLFINPVPDFVTFIRSWLDIWKQLFFMTIFWVTLIVIFLTSSLQVNVFSVGYLIACLIMFWRGEDFYLYSIKNMVRHWNIMIAYNLAVIFTKMSLQPIVNLLVWHYGSYMCILLGALSVPPVPHPGSPADVTQALIVDASCTPSTQPVITWDIISYAFLIITRRAFVTYYFIHVINDAKASSVTSAWGSEIFDKIQLRRISIRVQKERTMIERLKEKMAALRREQAKLQENPLFVSPDSHYDAIRAGDYFMFDEGALAAEDEARRSAEAAAQRLREVRLHQLRGKPWELMDASDQRASDADAAFPTPQPTTFSQFIEYTKTHSMAEAVESVRKREDGTNEDEENQTPVTTETKGRKRDKKNRKRCTFLKWMYYLIDSGVRSLALMMYGYSKNYRFVVSELRKQKMILLESGKLEGYRYKGKYIWTPNVRKSSILSLANEIDENEEIFTFQAKLHNTAEKAQGQFLRSSHESSFFSLLTSVYYIVIAYSELLCYFLIILLQMLESSVLSLTMCAMIFLWACLSVPRPSKTFWVTLMLVIEIVLVMKTIVQFYYFPIIMYTGTYIADKQNESMIKGTDNSTPTMILALCIFVSILFHRFRLRKFGLWEDAHRVIVSTDEQGTSFTYAKKEDKIKFHGLEDFEDPPPFLTKEVYESESESKYFPTIFLLVALKYKILIFTFFNDLFTSPTRTPVDVYMWLFILNAFCFLLTILGVRYFSIMGRDWYWYVDRNRFPLSIFVLLFGQFVLMVIDRSVYDRKSVKAKLVLYFLDIIATHVFLFVYLPVTAFRNVNDSSFLQILYFVRCITYLLSAYQIRNGYDIYQHGYVFRNRYGLGYLIFVFIYMNIPFFFELRTTIDWVSTDSAASCREFFKVEDVYFTAYKIKCSRAYERVRSKKYKYGMMRDSCSSRFWGAVIVTVFVFVLWFPLLLFQLRHELGVPVKPNSVNLKLAINNFPALYEASSFYIRSFTKKEWDDLKELYSGERHAQETIDYFRGKEMAVVKLPKSESVSNLPEEATNLMTQQLQSNSEDVNIKLSWKIEYSYRRDVTVEGYKIRPLARGDPTRGELAALVQGGGAKVVIKRLLPKFLDTSQVGSSTDPEAAVTDAFLTETDPDGTLYRNVELSRQPSAPARRRRQAATVSSSVWSVQEVCSGKDWNKYLRRLPEGGCSNIVLYIFSERHFGFWLDILSSMGAKTIYYLILFTLWKVGRAILRNTTVKLVLTEMPYPDRVLELCHNIYSVRIARHFDLEEDLYGKLLFLLRSPETLIMYTRKPVFKEKES